MSSYKVILDNGCQGEVKPSAYLFTLAMCIYSGTYIFSKIVNYIESNYKNNDSSNKQDNKDNNIFNNKSSFDFINKFNKRIYEESDDEDGEDNFKSQSEILDMYCNYYKDLMPKTLNERMQFYETYTLTNITKFDPFTDFVIKINGSNFFKLFQDLKDIEFNNLKTPFINDFKRAIDFTTVDLIKEFNAATGYNHSDEIILVFKSYYHDTDDELHPRSTFNGNVNKILSAVSSFAAVRFQKYLHEFDEEKYKNICDNICFVATHIIFPNDNELVNYFLWKSKYVCFNNFVNEMYNYYFESNQKCTYTNKDINITQDKIRRLLIEHKVDVKDYNLYLQNGVFIKRQLEKVTTNYCSIWQNKYTRFVLPNIKCNSSYIDLIKCKNFNTEEFNDVDIEMISRI